VHRPWQKVISYPQGRFRRPESKESAHTEGTKVTFQKFWDLTKKPRSFQGSEARSSSMDGATRGILAKHGETETRRQRFFPCPLLVRELEASNGLYQGIMHCTCYGVKSDKGYQEGFDGTKGLKYPSELPCPYSKMFIRLKPSRSQLTTGASYPGNTSRESTPHPRLLMRKS
jgi:hypothetical protein